MCTHACTCCYMLTHSGACRRTFTYTCTLLCIPVCTRSYTLTCSLVHTHRPALVQHFPLAHAFRSPFPTSVLPRADARTATHGAGSTAQADAGGEHSQPSLGPKQRQQEQLVAGERCAGGKPGPGTRAQAPRGVVRLRRPCGRAGVRRAAAHPEEQSYNMQGGPRPKAELSEHGSTTPPQTGSGDQVLAALTGGLS